MKKTVDMEMLTAKMEVLIRRYTELNYIYQANNNIISYGGFTLDTGRRSVFLNGKEIPLPYKEYEILLYMLKNRGCTLTFEQIYESVWKDRYLEDKPVIFYHIGQLRKLIGEGWIENIHGIGYRLSDKIEEKAVSEKP